MSTTRSRLGINEDTGRVDDRDGHSELLFGVNNPSDPHKPDKTDVVKVGGAGSVIGMPLAAASPDDEITAENARPQRNNNATEDDRFEVRKVVGAGSEDPGAGNRVLVGLVNLASEPQNKTHGRHTALGRDMNSAPRTFV